MKDDSSSADNTDSNEFEILSAEDDQLEYICKIEMMAGTQRKDALNLIKTNWYIKRSRDVHFGHVN